MLKCDRLKVGYINILSAARKILGVQTINYQEEYDIMLLSETWFEGAGKKINGFKL